MAIDPTLILLVTFLCARAEGVNPAFAAAVFNVESRGEGKEFRCGPLGKAGKYYGPAGINKDCKIDRDLLNHWPSNILIGVRSLKPRKGEKTERDILRRYNSKCDGAYVKAVMVAKKNYQRKIRGWR